MSCKVGGGGGVAPAFFKPELLREQHWVTAFQAVGFELATKQPMSGDFANNTATLNWQLLLIPKHKIRS